MPPILDGYTWTARSFLEDAYGRETEVIAKNDVFTEFERIDAHRSKTDLRREEGVAKNNTNIKKLYTTRSIMIAAATMTMGGIAATPVFAEEIQPEAVSQEAADPLQSAQTEVQSAQSAYDEAAAQYSAAAEAQQNYEDAKAQIEANEQQIESNSEAVEQTTAEQAAVTEEIARTETQLSEAQENIRSAEENYDAVAEQSADSSEEELSAAESELAEAQAAEAELEAEHESQVSRVDEIQQNIEGTQSTIDAKNGEIDSIADKNISLAEENEQAGKDAEAQLKRAEELENSGEQMTPEYRSMMDKVDEAKDKVDSLNQEMEAEKQKADTLKEEQAGLDSRAEELDASIKEQEAHISEAEKKSESAAKREAVEKEAMDAAQKTADAAKDASDTAEKDSDSANADKQFASEALDKAKKALEDAKKQADKAKNTADTADEQIAKGSKGFFEYLGDEDALRILSLENLKEEDKGYEFTDIYSLREYSDEEYERRLEKTRNDIHMGEKNDATSLENMAKALEMIGHGNDIRAKEEGLPPLKVASYLMACGQVYADGVHGDIVRAKDYGGMTHLSYFNVAENLAPYGYNLEDPYLGWFYEEKENVEKGSGQTGHYENLINTEYQATGYGVRTDDTKYSLKDGYHFHPAGLEVNSQTFGSHVVLYSHVGSDGYDLVNEPLEYANYDYDEYVQMFNDYYLPLKNASKNYQDALKAVEEAQKLVDKAQAEYDRAVKEASEKEGILAQKQLEYKNAESLLYSQKKVYSQAVKNAETARSQLQSETDRLDTLNRQKASILEQIAGTKSDIQATEERLATLAGQIDGAEDQYNAAREALDTSDPAAVKARTILELREGAKAIENRIKANEDRIAANAGKIDALKAEIEQLEADKAEAEKELSDAVTKAAETFIRLQDAQADADMKSKAVEDIRSVLQKRIDAGKAVDEAKAAWQEIADKKAELEEKLAELGNRIDALIRENGTLENANVELAKLAESYLDGFKDIREKEEALKAAGAVLEEKTKIYVEMVHQKAELEKALQAPQDTLEKMGAVNPANTIPTGVETEYGTWMVEAIAAGLVYLKLRKKAK